MPIVRPPGLSSGSQVADPDPLDARLRRRDAADLDAIDRLARGQHLAQPRLHFVRQLGHGLPHGTPQELIHRRPIISAMRWLART